ncbi:MAG: hypothetical protein WCO67_19215, partial [Betaproteobacteria bacterium]
MSGNTTTTAAHIESALEALSTIDDVAVTWNATASKYDVKFLVTTGSSFNVATLTSPTSGVTITVLNEGADATGKLYSKLPFINKSAAQIFGNGGVDFVTELRDAFKAATAAVTNLTDLEADLNTRVIALFSSAGMTLEAAKPITLEYKDSAFYLKIDIGLVYTTTIPLSMNLAELDPTLASIASTLGLTFNTGGSLAVTARADLDFAMGFDLKNVLQPDLFFEDTAGLELSIDVRNATPLSLQATLNLPVVGDVGIQVIDGSASVHVAMGFGLKDDSADDGRYNFGELKGAFEVYFRGDAEANLPMYFPIEALPMGGTTSDLNGDGLGDNVLHVAGSLDATVGQGITTNFEVVIPSLVPSIDLFALLNDPETLLLGIDGMFKGIKSGLNDKFASLALPLIGDKLKDAANFVDGLRDSLLGVAAGQQLTDATDELRYNTGTLGRLLAHAITTHQTVSDLIVGWVTTELYHKLGAYNLNGAIAGEPKGLDILRVVERDSAGKPVYDSATGSPRLRSVTSASDVQMTLDGNGLKFNVTLGDSILKWIFPDDGDGVVEFLEYDPVKDAVSIPIDFSAAIPGFSLSTGENDTIDLRFNYVLGLGFGLSKADGFYLDTSGVTESGAELQIDLSATVSAGASLNAQVVFLNGQLKDVWKDASGNIIDGRPSGLYGQFTVDLQDSGGNGRYTFFKPSFLGTAVPETLAIVATLSAVADVDLAAKLSIDPIDIGGGTMFDFPSITTTLHYDQVFAKATFGGTSSSSSTFGGKPVIVFEDVSLNLGEFITGFVGPIVQQVHAVTKPLEPLAKMLTAEIPLLKELGASAYTLLDIAGTVLGQTKYAGVVKAVRAIIEVIQLVKAVDAFLTSSPGPLVINFGDFVVGG